jgi:hydrogenase nickel incorporation protein HypA/HybF
LEFSYEIACQGTALEGSRLIVEDVPVMVHCANCRQDTVVESIQRLRCVGCGELSAEIVQGRDLEVVALEIEEAEESVI